MTGHNTNTDTSEERPDDCRCVKGDDLPCANCFIAGFNTVAGSDQTARPQHAE